MSQNPSLIQHYETIACITGKMLAEARAQHWDTVVELGTQYHQAVEHLRTFSPLDSDDRQARRALLTKILEDDASIRRLATPEIDRLGLLIGTMKRQQSVLQAYYGPSQSS